MVPDSPAREDGPHLGRDSRKWSVPGAGCDRRAVACLWRSSPVAVESAEEYLEHHAALLAEEGFDVSTRVEIGPAARTLTDVQESAPEHLLVMASVVRRGWLRALLGCTAAEVIRMSGRPLLLIPAGRRPGPSGSDDGASGGSNGSTNA